jgi:phage terminase small subunit
MNQQVALPQSRFGISQTRYNLPALPDNLPERSLLQAANTLNEHRYFRLTVKQRLFVDEYFACGFDEAAAALKAGLAETEEDAPRVGRKLLRKEYIRDAVDAAFDYHRESVKISLPEIIGEIRKVAFSNMGDYFTADANGEPQLCLPGEDQRHLLAAIQEITVDEYKEGRGDNARECKRVKFKLYSKLEALEKLLKIANVKGVAEEPAQVTVNNTNNNSVSVTAINIVPVPSGQFIPAPQRPDMLVEHSPLIKVLANT